MQRWRARRRIKEGEKLGGDFSKAGAANRESNVEHMQTAASSNERGKIGENSRAWRHRKEKSKGNPRTAAGPGNGDWRWAERFRFRLAGEKTSERKTQEEKSNAKKNGVSAS